MYPRRQADIEKMDYDIVAQVAEAVEKYQIFSAHEATETVMICSNKWRSLAAVVTKFRAFRFLDPSSRPLRGSAKPVGL